MSSSHFIYGVGALECPVCWRQISNEKLCQLSVKIVRTALLRRCVLKSICEEEREAMSVQKTKLRNYDIVVTEMFGKQ